MIKVELLKKENEDQLTDFINRSEKVLVQQSLEWRDAILDMGTDEAMYLIAKNSKNEVIGYMPAFFYQNELGNIIQSSPYPASYGGIVSNFDGIAREKIFQAIIFELLKIAKDKKCILVSIFTPPFRENDYELYKKYLSPTYEKEKIYQYIRLVGSSLNEFNARLGRDIKRSIKKAEKYSFEIQHSIDEKEMIEWYNESLTERMNAVGGYTLPIEWCLSLLKNVIKKGKGEFFLIKKDKKIIGGGVFVYNNYVIDDYFSTAKTEFLKTGANSYLLYHTIVNAFKRGIKYFNWQSSPENSKGVYNYKSRWGSLEGKNWYLVKVIEDINHLLKLPLEELKEAYKWHFIFPFEIIINR